MRYTSGTLALAAVCWLVGQAPVRSGGKGDDAVQVIDLKGAALPPARGKVDAPTVITTKDELAKAFPDATTQERIAKQVDLSKKRLLFFAWSGSGGDKLTFEVVKSGKAPEILFHYQPGLTRDLRPHYYLFAVPTDASYRVERKKG